MTIYVDRQQQAGHLVLSRLQCSNMNAKLGVVSQLLCTHCTWCTKMSKPPKDVKAAVCGRAEEAVGLGEYDSSHECRKSGR